MNQSDGNKVPFMKNTNVSHVIYPIHGQYTSTAPLPWMKHQISTNQHYGHHHGQQHGQHHHGQHYYRHHHQGHQQGMSIQQSQYEHWIQYYLVNNQIAVHKLMVDNIKQLSKLSIEKNQSLHCQLEKKTKQCDSISEQNNILKRQLRNIQDDYDILLKKSKRTSDKNVGTRGCNGGMDGTDGMDSDYGTISKNDEPQRKKQKLIVYLKTDKSLDADKINKLMLGINNIDDIIKLEQYSHEQIRHHLKLQKLYSVIEPLKKLQSMVGLKTIKQEMFKHIIFFIQGNAHQDMLHTVITGPPGVGKSQLGRIIGKIYLGLGLLSNDTFKQVRRSDLIGGYLGQTATKTQKVINGCLGGVLFIDEAYSLGNNSNGDSYAKECIDTINQNLTENKSKFVCIIAGYEECLDRCFFSTNPGLKRRFSFKHNIESYQASELSSIFMSKITNSGWNLDPLVDMVKFIKHNMKHLPHFGGDVETLLFYGKLHASQRLFKHNSKYNVIKMIDLTRAMDQMALKTKKVDDVPLGMYC